MSDGVYLGLDLGTSGLKGVLLRADGRVTAQAQAGYSTARVEAGAAEQAPSAWIEALVSVVAQLRGLREADGAAFEIRAIGLSGMLPTLVTVDREGVPLGAAITWQDARAEPEGEALRERIGADEVYRTTGQWLDGRYLLPMFMRLAGVEPERAAATATLLGAKDYLLAWLTGTLATEPSTAAGVGSYRLDGGWDERIGDAAAELGGVPLPRLPELVEEGATFGLTAAAAGALGLSPALPVSVGGADSVLGAVGLGATHPGDVAYVAGTSTVILGTSGELRLDSAHRYLVTPLAGVTGWGLEMDLLATGSAIRWLARLTGAPDETALMALAQSLEPGEGPSFLPYVAPGEQGALWDPDLRGTIAGLTLEHEPRHLARALVTGMLVESRRCLNVLAAAGVRGAIHVGGGGATDLGFLQELADASGRTVYTRSGGVEADHSAVGAACVAASAIGEPMPPRGSSGEGRELVPRAERAAVWTRLAVEHDTLRAWVTNEGDRR